MTATDVSMGAELIGMLRTSTALRVSLTSSDVARIVAYVDALRDEHQQLKQARPEGELHRGPAFDAIVHALAEYGAAKHMEGFDEGLCK